MQRRFFLLSCFAIFCFGCATVKPLVVETGPNFRQASWWMTKEQVKAVETDKLDYETYEFLGYKGTVNGDKASVLYTFAADRLMRVGVRITPKVVSMSRLLSDFDFIASTLRAKYGEPVTDTTYDTVSFRYIRKEYLTLCSFASGRVTKTMTWETNKSKVRLALSGGAGEIHIWIDYECKWLTL